MGGSKFPNTNFRVQVLYNIKWKLEWDVTVRQEAGYNENWKLQILGWGEYLEEWKTYLLSIRWDMIMSHPNGSLLLSDNLDKNELKEFIIKNEIIWNFRKAYKNEIYYEWSFKISSGINAYKNLSREEKMNLENVENGFVEIEKVSDEAIYMANVSNQDYWLKWYTKIYIN
jgi:hypothetical protein